MRTTRGSYGSTASISLGQIGQAVAIIFGGGLIIWLLAGGRAGAEREAKFWESVPVRSEAQLADVVPGTPVVQTGGIADPDDWTGLAYYTLQREESYRTTETYRDSDGDTHTHTVTKHRWVDDRRLWPATMSIAVPTEDGPMWRIEVMPGYSPSGAMRYVNLHTDWGAENRRAVGWSFGDAVLVVGMAGKEPGQIQAQLVTSQSEADWRKGMQNGPGVYTFFMWMSGIIAAVAAGWALLGDMI